MSMLFLSSLPSSRRATLERQAWGRLFGSLIQGVREKDGRTLEEIARQAGMTVAEWEALEAGQVPSTSEQLCSITNALGTSRSGMASVVFLCAGAWGR